MADLYETFTSKTFLFGWLLLPFIITKALLLVLRHANIIPQPETEEQKNRQYGVIHAIVLLWYLIYTTIEYGRTVENTLYKTLYVPYDVNADELQKVYMFSENLFKKKVETGEQMAGEEYEAALLSIQKAYDVLKDPPLRAAYDRFGFRATSWRKDGWTTRDYTYRGAQETLRYHAVHIAVNLVFDQIIRPRGRFWRYLILVALFAGELSIALSPFERPPRLISGKPSYFDYILTLYDSTPSSFSPASSAASSVPGLLPTSFLSILQTIFPKGLPYQHICVLRYISAPVSLIVTQLASGPFGRFLDEGLPKPKEENKPEQHLDALQRSAIERVCAELKTADAEASQLVHTVLTSISPSSLASAEPHHDSTFSHMRPLEETSKQLALENITPELEKLVVEARIKEHAPGNIAAACEAALRAFKSWVPRTSLSQVSARRDGSNESRPPPTLGKRSRR